MDTTLLWVWLSLHMKAGTHVYNYLLEEFGSIEAIYDCDDNDVRHIPWMNDSQKKKILDKNTDRAKEVIRWCNKYGVKIVTIDSEDYPSTLHSLVDKPAVLYYVGTMPDFEKELAIAVIGTRDMTTYGEQAAFEIGYGLSKGGAIVISGGAIGIDSTAQKGAILAEQPTVAVLGSGIDTLYPAQNKEMFLKIMEIGVVMTEYPPFTPPNGYNFPVRNRLISGMSHGVVVVEADKNSGAMITADKALKQNKPLYSVPGPIGRFQSSGTNELIRNNAKAVTCALDVLEDYLDRYSEIIKITASKEKPDLRALRTMFTKEDKHTTISQFLEMLGFKKKTKSSSIKPNNKETIKQENNDVKIDIDALGLDENTKKIYNYMEPGKKYNADSLEELKFETSIISSAFTMLEMYGAVRRMPGGFFVKN